MIGAVIGDIIGSPYEGHAIKTTQFPLFSQRSRFTDDTVLTVATADALLHGLAYEKAYRNWGREYPHAGYGGTFIRWISTPSMGPYNSFGNGAAMRIAPVGYCSDHEYEVLEEARKSASVSHDHPEGVKGASAVALAILLSRKGKSKADIKTEIAGRFGYNLDRSLDEIRPAYRFDVTCQGSVPEAIIAFLESNDYETAVRNAVSLGGDSDTQACISGAIAEPFYNHIPENIISQAVELLPEQFRNIIAEFKNRYDTGGVQI